MNNIAKIFIRIILLLGLTSCLIYNKGTTYDEEISNYHYHRNMAQLNVRYFVNNFQRDEVALIQQEKIAQQINQANFLQINNNYNNLLIELDIYESFNPFIVFSSTLVTSYSLFLVPGYVKNNFEIYVTIKDSSGQILFQAKEKESSIMIMHALLAPIMPFKRNNIKDVIGKMVNYSLYKAKAQGVI
jgi:hypothetical protein